MGPLPRGSPTAGVWHTVCTQHRAPGPVSSLGTMSSEHSGQASWTEALLGLRPFQVLLDSLPVCSLRFPVPLATAPPPVLARNHGGWQLAEDSDLS